MPLTSKEWDTLVATVRSASSNQIMPRFRNLGASDVATKSSATDLVTLADTEAEAAMTKALRAAWPEAAVIGEEAISADASLIDQIDSAGRIAILDPVDGTWNFAKGLALFGVIVAIAEAGQTVAGMLYDPVLDDWIIADRDGPAQYVRPGAPTRTLATSAIVAPSQIGGYVPLGLLPFEARGEVIGRSADFNRVMSLRCACHEYRMVAQGHVEFCLSGPVPNAWDHAAGSLIVQQAGGVSRMLGGSEYQPGTRAGYILTAASHEVWELCAERFDCLLS